VSLGKKKFKLFLPPWQNTASTDGSAATSYLLVDHGRE